MVLVRSDAFKQFQRLQAILPSHRFCSGDSCVYRLEEKCVFLSLHSDGLLDPARKTSRGGNPWASVLISWMLAQVGRLIIRTGGGSLACQLNVSLDLWSLVAEVRADGPCSQIRLGIRHFFQNSPTNVVEDESKI